MRVLLSLCIVGILVATPALGQDLVAEQSQPRKAPPAAPEPPPPPPLPAPPRQAPPAPPPPTARAINIQVEFTITDQVGSNPPLTKSVSLIASDATFGRVRAAANVRPNDRTGNVGVELNVDARPTVLTGDNIRLEFTIEYRPLSSVTGGDPSQMTPTSLNQNMNVILQNGKPLVVSQAADPVSDRKIIVEARATVLK